MMKPAPQEIATVVKMLQSLALEKKQEYASLYVRADGRGSIEVYGHRGCQSIDRLDMTEDGTVTIESYATKREDGHG